MGLPEVLKSIALEDETVIPVSEKHFTLDSKKYRIQPLLERSDSIA